jgi:hypothetical protein
MKAAKFHPVSQTWWCRLVREEKERGGEERREKRRGEEGRGGEE